MVKSIYFPVEGNGYIYSKPEEPNNPKSYRDYKRADDEGRKKLMAQYKKDLSNYRKNKDNYLLPCANLLIGKKFEFKPNKVNIIFGPNGAGKSTILRAIAGEAGVHDGFTKGLEPLDAFGWNEEKMTIETFKKTLEDNFKKNTCSVAWDGAPIYYHNFGYTEQNARGTFGEYGGSILGNSIEGEITYHLSKNRISSGQKSLFFINKLIEIAKQPISMADIMTDIQENVDKKKFNEIWNKSYETQLNYYKKFEKYNEKCPITMLFDELDKSLDVEKVWALMVDVMPKMCEKFGVQIICVTHNPLVLSNVIYGDKEHFNFISIDKEYTEDMRKMLSNVNFS